MSLLTYHGIKVSHQFAGRIDVNARISRLVREPALQRHEDSDYPFSDFSTTLQVAPLPRLKGGMERGALDSIRLV